ncbi:putative hydrolase YutF [Corynebacterium ciconiae DSM 44920]|uniref:HAD-IIA family hydrolase n=1 Tax=Corynebacterium ciconiae TaxID=227319 RepID=UPI00036DC8B6|nr:HAD-IIA family hydrolase [Corynebacterium ciconiae]WKD61113.1 putative hydrolase YutF [Corynebacterium ciconiae DSM 44920]
MCLSKNFDLLIFDLDGTVYAGGDPIEHAVDSILAADMNCQYVTNNASRAPEVVAEQLSSLGLRVSPSDVLTSAQAAVAMVAQEIEPGARVYVVGADSFKELTRDAGFEVVESADAQPAAVLHGHNPATGWAELSEAALAIGRGARYFASNLDTTLPMERGLHVGNGSMVAAVATATGVTPQSAGKPGPTMFLAAAHRTAARRPLSIGDRLNTDIAGSVAAGIPSLHVLTGVSGCWDVLNAPVAERARYVAADLRALDMAADAVDPFHTDSHGNFSATYDADRGTLSIGGEPIDEEDAPLEALRAALAVVWTDSEASHELNSEAVHTSSDEAARAVAQWW